MIGGDDRRVVRARCRGRRRTSGRSSGCRPGSGAGSSATSSRCRSRRRRAARRVACSWPRSVVGAASPSSMSDALGDLEARALRGVEPGLVEAWPRRGRRGRLGELAAGDVHAHGERRRASALDAASASTWRQASSQDPRADRDDEAGLLGERDEVGRARPAPRSGCCQRTSASTPTIAPVASATLGLVVDDAARRGRCARAQVGLDRRGGRRRGSRSDLVEELDQRPPPRLLGAVHGGVGVADQRRPASAVSSVAMAMPMLALDEGLGRRRTRTGCDERLEDPLGDRDRVLLRRRGPRTAPRTRRRRSGRCVSLAADGRRAAARPPRAAAVAGGVAEAVVDHLEAVEVEEEHRDAACRCAPGAASALLQAVMSSTRLGRPVSGSRSSCCSFVRQSDDVREARGEHEAAVDERPAPRVRGGLRDGVDANAARGRR